MSKKLTPSQVAVLEAAVGPRWVGYHDAASVGGSGRTLGALVSRGLLTERRLANKQRVWDITEAGYAALREASP